MHLALYPMNRRRSGFSKNLVGTRSRPGGFRIWCGHTSLGDFGDFVEMKSRSKHKIIKVVVFRCLQCKLTLDNAEELRSHVENPECKGPIYAKVSLKRYTKSDIIDFDLL